MPLTAEELQARKSRVGASDVAALLGVPTFRGRNAYSLWLDKTDQLEPEDEAKKPWLRAGHRLESVVLDYAEDELGELERNIVVHDPTGAPVASTLDGQVKASLRPVEAKTSGVFGPIHGDWGEPGGDDVPLGYLIQCETQLLCTGVDVCHLVALLGQRGFVHYQIDPEDSLHRLIRNASQDFFERYVTPKRDPRGEWGERLSTVHGWPVETDPCNPDIEVVRRLRKVPGTSVAISADLVLAWAEAQKKANDAKKYADAKKAEVLASIGTKAAGLLPDGSYVERCTERGQWQFDRDAMKRDGVLEVYGEQGTREVLRHRKAGK